ncbi:MAG: mechanosensitive ion channel [Deltaproteobacteria bacterium]|nr:mechanosensitive ion channel [Deltaproteobacteria bacterium]
MGDLIAAFQEALIGWGPNLVAAVAIFVVGGVAAKFATALVARGMDRAGVDVILVRFVRNIAYAGLMALIVIAALGRLGVNTTSFAAVIAAAGLAIGLAFQSSLSNFAAGVLLIVFRPFNVGDYVEVGGVSGSVEEVQVFTTVLRTPDNKKVILGNAAITDASITNYAAYDTRRIDLVFGVGYDDDLRLTRDVISRVLSQEGRVLQDPAPTIGVGELADSSVNFVVRPWVRTSDYWNVRLDLTEAMKLASDEAGLSIPFPQSDVHLQPVQAA